MMLAPQKSEQRLHGVTHFMGRLRHPQIILYRLWLQLGNGGHPMIVQSLGLLTASLKDSQPASSLDATSATRAGHSMESTNPGGLMAT
jgi:hypothetical protein